MAEPTDATGSAAWRYTFCDLLTDDPIAVLPLRDADLTETIGEAGPGRARVQLDSEQARRHDVWGATTPRRTICYAQRVVRREGVEVAAPVLWHGIVWGRVRSGRDLSLVMATPESYYAHRLVRWNRTYKRWDDARMLRDVFTRAESTPSGSLGLRYTSTLAGVASDRTLLADDLRTVLETATSIATAGAGLDWRIRPGLDPVTGRFTKTLEVAPRLGRVGVPELRWQTSSRGRAPNEVIAYTYEEDGTGVANLVVGLGAGQPPEQLRSTATAAQLGIDELALGWPLLERQYSGGEELKQQGTLDRHTLGVLAAGYGAERRVTGLTVRGDLSPTLDRYSLGDEVRLDLDDPLQPDPTTVLGRVVTRRIAPGQPGRTERVAMELGGT